MAKPDALTTQSDRSSGGEIVPIRLFLAAVSNRQRIVRTLRCSSVAIIAASALIIVCRLAAYLLLWPLLLTSFSWQFAGIAYIVSVAAALFVALRQPFDEFLVARYVDDVLGLKDRLASALSVRLFLIDPEYASKIVGDASTAVKNIAPSQVIQIKLHRLQWAALIVLLSTLFVSVAPISLLSPGNITVRRLITAEQLTATTVKARQKHTAWVLSPAPNSPASSARNAPLSVSQIPTLSEKLRQFADRLSERQLTSGELKQAAQSLGQLNRELDGKSMPQTQKYLAQAQQHLNDSQQTAAINDLRSAASAADHEGPTNQSGGSAQTPGKDSVSIGHGQQSASPNHSSSANANGSASQSGQTKNQAQGGGNGKAQQGEQSGSGNGNGQQNAGSGKGTSNTGTGPGHGGIGDGGGNGKPNFGAAKHIDTSSLSRSIPPAPMLLPISSLTGRSSQAAVKSSGKGQLGRSVVPYQTLNRQFTTVKEPSLNTDNIPPGYQAVVKRYFSQ